MDYQTIMKLHEILMSINLKVEEYIYNFFLFLRFFCICLEYILRNFNFLSFKTLVELITGILENFTWASMHM
jgi:hypothetical protein